MQDCAVKEATSAAVTTSKNALVNLQIDTISTRKHHFFLTPFGRHDPFVSIPPLQQTLKEMVMGGEGRRGWQYHIDALIIEWFWVIFEGEVCFFSYVLKGNTAYTYMYNRGGTLYVFPKGSHRQNTRHKPRGAGYERCLVPL